MSKIISKGIEAVEESIFTFIDEGRAIEVLNAFIFWTNFRGETNRFGNDARTFNLAVSADVGRELQSTGWRVRSVEQEDGTLYFINVKLNMNSAYPPTVSLFSEFKGKRTKRPLDVGSVGELDRIDIKSADCVINAYESSNFPGKITGYLRKLNVIQEPDIEFGGKYDDWIDEETDCLAAGTCTIEEWKAGKR